MEAKFVLKRNKQVDELLLKNAIRMLIGGYLYDTDLREDVDEWKKLNEIPGILEEMKKDYEKKIWDLEENN
jgi:hypothetical protein